MYSQFMMHGQKNIKLVLYLFEFDHSWNTSTYSSSNSKSEISPRSIQRKLSCAIRTGGRSDMTAQILAFLGAFAELRKATISFVMPVCPHGCHWTDFHEILYSSIFRKSVVKIQVSLQSDKNNGYFT